MHLDIVVDKLKNKFGVEVEMQAPKIHIKKPLEEV